MLCQCYTRVVQLSVVPHTQVSENVQLQHLCGAAWCSQPLRELARPQRLIVGWIAPYVCCWGNQWRGVDKFGAGFLRGA
jgi:hypothetical protein